MMLPDNIEEFSSAWIAAWNTHDLESILSHYEDDFEMSSPIIIPTMDEPSGKLKGKDRVRSYWAKALANYPDLHFEKQQVLVGVNSVTIIYQGVKGLSAEVFCFGETGQVAKAYAHYGL